MLDNVQVNIFSSQYHQYTRIYTNTDESIHIGKFL